MEKWYNIDYGLRFYCYFCHKLKSHIMNIQVEKTDIDLIGHTCYSENGNLAIICSTDTSGIEQILLRNILKCFGEEYKIVDEYDTDSEEIEYSDIVFETNLPYSIYQSVCDEK